MTGYWPWLALAGLGFYHGINPGMGWLFAVALGLHRGSRRVVWWSVLPIALGHAAAIAIVVLIALAVGQLVDTSWPRRLAGLLLIGWAVWHLWRGSRHKVRVGMRAGFWGLGFWSFLMASAHGAGLMLLPIVLPGAGHQHTGHAHAMPGETVATALAALSVHTLAMLLATLAVAVLVYEWLGVAILRRAWVNFDLLWVVALIVTGLLLLVT